MKSDAKHFIIAGTLSLVAYLGFYQCDKQLRTRNGPWEVRFGVEAGTPTVTVNEPHLKVANVKFQFPGESVTNVSDALIVFDSPIKTNIPFGRVVFLDTTYLPGTATMNFFGHEIELLPRTLVVNRKEVAWEGVKTISLKPEEKLPTPPETKKKKRY